MSKLLWFRYLQKKDRKLFSVYFLLFPHRKIFLFFGISLSNLEKIGIDEKVICYHNISNLLWEKDVLCAWKRKWISKTLQILGLRPRICKTFSWLTFLDLITLEKFKITLEQIFLTVGQNNYCNKIPFLNKKSQKNSFVRHSIPFFLLSWSV